MTYVYMHIVIYLTGEIDMDLIDNELRLILFYLPHINNDVEIIA